MTRREEIASLYDRLADAFARLAVLYHDPGPPAPPRGPKPATPPAEHDEPENVNQADGPKPQAGTMTGKQFLGWLREQPDPQAILHRAQSLGKRRGYGWQIVGWGPDQVADVYHEITAKAPAGSYRQAVRR